MKWHAVLLRGSEKKFRWDGSKVTRVWLCQHCQCCIIWLLKAALYGVRFIGFINHIGLWTQSMLTCSHEATASHRLNSNDRPSALWVIGSLCKKKRSIRATKMIIGMRHASLVTRGGRQSKYYNLLTDHAAGFQKHKMLGKHRTKCTLRSVS